MSTHSLSTMEMETSCDKHEFKGCSSVGKSMVEAGVVDSREETGDAFMDNNDQRYAETTPEYMKGFNASFVWDSFLDEAAQTQPRWGMEFNLKGFIDIIKKIPFVKEKCEETFEVLEKALEGSSSSDELRIRSAAHEIYTYLGETNRAVQKTYFTLLMFGALNQADGSLTFSRKRKHSAGGTSNVYTAVPKHAQDAFDNHIKQLRGACDPGEFLRSIFEEGNVLQSFAEKGNGHKIGNFSALTSQQQVRISNLNSSLQNAFSQAKLINKEIHIDYSTILSSLENTLIDASSEISCKMHLPGPMASEVECVQPFLLTILRSLGAVLEDLNSNEKTVNFPNCEKGVKSQTPEKTVMINRSLAGTSYRKRRVADKAIAADGNFIFLHFDDSIEVAAEAKPGERKGKGPKDLQNEGRDQVFSHLGKYVYVGFNLLGLGADTYATGVYVTVTHVKFYRLKLVHMGTPNTKLQFQETPNMPILSKKNFDKFVLGGGAKKLDQWKSYREEMYGIDETFNNYCQGGTNDLEKLNKYMEEMYGGDDKSQMTDNSPSSPDVPSGLVALLNLMSTPRKDLFGSPIGSKSEKVGELLGTGSFASVYTSLEEKNCVVKFSRFGAREMLDNEAEILKMTNSEKDIGIVRILGDQQISIHIGGIIHQLPALTLTPRGVPASIYLLSLKDVDKKKATIKAIGKRLLDALSFLHKRSIYWNDGSVYNIMFDQSVKKAFLIDFGMASHHRHTLKGFVGTPRFAHREIFQKYPSTNWEPKADYDNTALAFSIATLSNNGCCCPWRSFQPETLKKNETRQGEFNTWANNRSLMAWKSLETIGFGNDWRGLCLDGENEG